MNTDNQKKSSLVGDVAKVASGTAVAQGVTVLIAPIITRLYSPDDFGMLGVFLSIISVVGVNSTLRYHLAILLPDDDRDAAALSGLSIICTLSISLLTLLFLLILSEQIESWFDVVLPSVVYLIIPFAIVVNAGTIIIRQWHIRYRAYGTAAVSEASQSLGNAGGQLGFGFTGLTSGLFLVLSSVIGQTIALLIYLQSLPRKVVFFSRNLFNARRIKEQALIHRKFPQYSTPGGIINKLAWELPSFLLLFFFNAEILGFYILGHRLLRMPVSLIGNSIGQVYFERGVASHKAGNLDVITELMQKRLVQLGFFPFLVLTFVGEELFIIFFGSEWAIAGVFTQILAIWTFVWFISGPLSVVFNITNSQDKMLRIQALLFILRFIGLLIGGLYGSAILAITLFAIAGILGYGYLMFQISKIARISPLHIAQEIFSLWPAVLIFIIVYSMMQLFSLNTLLITIISTVLLIGYYLFIFWKEPELKVMVKKLVK
ncbi:MAG: oligosaccharide flippase family protein [Balneolaceae bacterium]